MDPRYIGQDIDLATPTEDQIPELRRRAAVAKEEHERLMQEKRERLAAQEQATLEAEIALEELRLQRLRQRDEAERLQGPFARPARDTSQRRRDAETPRQLGEWQKARRIEAKWTSSLQLGAGGRDRPVGQLRVVAKPRIRTETLLPPWVGRYILLATTMIQSIGARGPTLKDLAKARATKAAGGPS